MVQRTFLAIAVIVITARVVGLLFTRMRQPRVMGELVGGILLGPTLLGTLVDTTLFPVAIRPSLDTIGQLGLGLYMFLVGLRMRLETVRSNPRMVSVISLASVVVPFALAMPLAIFLFSRHREVAGHTVDQTAFFLFLGTSLAVTAFPVLARILEERRMQNTELGALATACAALQDVFGWCMLAVVLAIVHSGGAMSGLVRIVLEAVACVAGIWALSRALGMLETRLERSSGPMLVATVVAGVLLSAGATQAIGLHAVFGAFLFGIALRRSLSSAASRRLVEHLEPLTAGVLLPVYFVTPGLQVNLRAIPGGGAAEIGLILLAACAGKMSGAYVAGRASGLGARHAAIMGTLMNSRGLVELVVLQVARSAGILDGRLFSELVLMALVTTMIAAPLLDLLLRPAGDRAEEAGLAKLLALGAPP